MMGRGKGEKEWEKKSERSRVGKEVWATPGVACSGSVAGERPHGMKPSLRVGSGVDPVI